ncbi:coiled-coil domain-containing protein 86-like [Hydractinia symbiolongicarpus]|nr:coiled-coil domain-containing protein 86-like [Hydractinia symbiolongicarpus]
MAPTNIRKKNHVVKGKPKSGRVWKSEGRKKSTIINVKSLHTSWEKRKKERAEKMSVKQFQMEIKKAASEEKEKRRLRAEENKKRREENIKNAEIVQKITNSAKLKRMKKKQLRQIKKR